MRAISLLLRLYSYAFEFVLSLIVLDQVPDQDVCIQAKHHRDSNSTGTGFLLFL